MAADQPRGEKSGRRDMRVLPEQSNTGRCYRPRVMSGADTSLLIALCRTCHKTVDFDEQGKGRSAQSKERVLAELFSRETERLAGGSSLEAVFDALD
jgi:hypothetical protein